MSVDSDRSRADHWARAFEQTARAWWTPERLAPVTGGKKLLLRPDAHAPLLRAAGLLQRDARMPPKEVRKYRQVNHLLAALRPGLLALAERTRGTLRLVDAACGRSYLTLLLGGWLKHEGVQVQILGLDRQARLVKPTARRAAMVGLQDVVRTAAADLTTVDLRAVWAQVFGGEVGTPTVHGLVALHACDVATDMALALGVKAGASLLAVAPCCQAELAARWADEAPGEHVMAPVWDSPSLRRDLASTTTDALRAAWLRAAGFTVRCTEFVGSEHTAKNTLIRAVRGEGLPDPREAAGARAQHAALAAAMAAHDLSLPRLLPLRGCGPAAEQAGAAPGST